jgi:pyridoxine kinase
LGAPGARTNADHLIVHSELSGRSVDTEADTLAAIDSLHAGGIARVVVTSSELAPPDSNTMYVYSSDASTTGNVQRYRYVIDRLPANFVGTGDLFASLLLVWLHKTNKDLKVSMCACAHTYLHRHR